MTDAGVLRDRLVEQLRAEGSVTRDDVAAAFGAVPREVFLRDGFHDGVGGHLVRPGDPEFIGGAYRNDALVTKLADGIPVSSSSQPSIMAVMIEGLDLRPGDRVLEIGAGTGYNAALMAALGAEVTSVDAQPDVAGRAAAALAATGTRGVRVLTGDGYLGAPDGGPYDRVIVTVGVAGVSPHWLAQLRPDGYVLAPMRHAGYHPVLRVDTTPGAAGYCGAGFMSASGPLSATYPGGHPEPWRPDGTPVPTAVRPVRWDPPLAHRRFVDLWFAVGVWDRRATFGMFPGADGVLRDPVDGGAVVARDGSVQAFGPHAAELAADAGALVDRWTAAGAPPLDRWRATMALSGDPADPIWVPDAWSLAGRA